MSMAVDTILIQAVNDYLKRNPPQPGFNRLQLKHDILDETIMLIEGQNTMLNRGSRIKIPHSLANVQIARIIELIEPVICISCEKQEDSDETEFDLLGVYESSGPNEGIYNTSDKALDNLIAEYNMAVVKRDIDDIKQILRRRLPRKRRCMNRDLIAVNNGIFDYKAKVLTPFDPDKVFLSKSRVNYNPNAKNVTIHNPDDNTDWDVESWMAALHNDPQVVALLWEILGAIIRPFVRWDKSAWLYSTSGNSGKGTLCELMRNLCGRGSYASIALADFSKDFQLEPLIRSNAVIVDENDVGVYLDKVANLKAVITNDVILINRKFKTPVSYQFFGFMVQCLNEYPRIRDTSDSFYRRQLFIPFDKCFTGHARKYIKDDYLGRTEVLEYVLYKILNMDYYELSEPECCRAVLADYKEFNSPIQSFVEEIIPELKWGMLPFGFLYDLYKEWFAQNSPSGKVQGRNTFIKEIADMAEAGQIPEFVCLGRKTPVRPKNLMDCPEPMIVQYNLTRWMNPTYKGTDVNQICTTPVKATYCGLIRAGNEDDVKLPSNSTPADDATLDAVQDLTPHDPE